MNAAKKIFSTCLILLIIAFLFGLFFRGAAAQTRKVDKITFMLDWAIMGKYAPYFIALDKGFYRDEGIEPEIMKGYGGSSTAVAVDQGKVTFGLADLVNIALTRSKGGE